MTIWNYWNAVPPSKTRLRLLVPNRGWVAFDDKMEGDGEKVSERGSRELLESALINGLSASNFVSLTGLGTSMCASNGDEGSQPPTMADLWEAVKQAVGEQNFHLICNKFPKAKIDTNIEKLLSLCKVHLEMNDAAAAEDEDVTAVKDFVTQAEGCILQKVDFVSQSTVLTAHETFVRKIGRRGFKKARAKVFTTNYDLTLEEAARRQRFVIIDGFSHSLDQVYDAQHYEYDVVRRGGNSDAPDYIPNVLQLYKLHGSADWRRINGEVFRSRDNAKGTPVLIYPRSSKYQEAFEPPYLDMMSAFQSSLREPDTAIVVVGFGFNDDHISRPILSALETNLSLRLIFCDPCFIPSVNDLTGVAPHPPAHAIADTQLANGFIERIKALAKNGDERIHLVNGRFEDLVDAIPDLVGLTDRERHIERVKALREPTP